MRQLKRVSDTRPEWPAELAIHNQAAAFAQRYSKSGRIAKWQNSSASTAKLADALLHNYSELKSLRIAVSDYLETTASPEEPTTARTSI